MNTEKTLLTVGLIGSAIGFVFGGLINQVKIVRLEGELETIKLQYNTIRILAKNELEINKHLNEKLNEAEKKNTENK